MPDTDAHEATTDDPQVEIDRLRERVRILEAEKADALAARERAIGERDRHRGFRRVQARALAQAQARLAEIDQQRGEQPGS